MSYRCDVQRLSQLERWTSPGRCARGHPGTGGGRLWDMSLGPDSPEARRLRLAFEMHEMGKAMMRSRLRREHPEASEEEIRKRLAAWLRAPRGQAQGRPIELPRRG